MKPSFAGSFTARPRVLPSRARPICPASGVSPMLSPNTTTTRRVTTTTTYPNACAAQEPASSSSSLDASQQFSHHLPCITTAASSNPSLNDALTEVAARALASMHVEPHVAVVYVSVRYAVAKVGPRGRESLQSVVPKLRALLPSLKAVIGCCTDGVIGEGAMEDVVEIEDIPAVSLTLAYLPGVAVRAFHVMPDDMPTDNQPADAWKKLIHVDPPDSNSSTSSTSTTTTITPSFIVLSDSTFAERGELERFLASIENAYPSSSVVGSIASAGAAGAGGHMYCTLPRDVLSPASSSLRDSGLVGLALVGDIEMDSYVASCCRPIGPVFTVCTTADNIVQDLQFVGRPSTQLSAVAHLRRVLDYATPEERRLIQSDLHMGFADPDAVDVEDYVIRNVIGVDITDGAITVGTQVRKGQRARFFVKEREAACHALDAVMQRYKRAELAKSLVGYSNPPFGAMMFVDAGRGYALFREKGMETRNLSAFVQGVPISGFFGGAQIGPRRSSQESERGPAVIHNAANVIALIRKRSGLSPVNPPGSPPKSVDKEEKDS